MKERAHYVAVKQLLVIVLNIEMTVAVRLFVLFMFASGSSALAAPQTSEERLAQIERYCLSGDRSSSDYRNCLDDQVAKIDKELATAVRKRHFDIKEIELSTEKLPGSLAGKEDAKKYRLAFDREQATFSSYRKQKCENVYNFENVGGSNAGGFASKCHLRLTLQRIYDLSFGF